MEAVETGSVSVSSLFYSCGFIIPTIWENVYYKEGMNLLHIFGILFIFASFVLSSRLKKDKGFKVVWLAALGGTLFSGLVGVAQKLV